MTIIPFAAAICIDCRAPVAIVRRTVEVPCDASCGFDGCECHTHPVPDVGPFTLVDAEGERHQCE